MHPMLCESKVRPCQIHTIWIHCSPSAGCAGLQRQALSGLVKHLHVLTGCKPDWRPSVLASSFLGFTGSVFIDCVCLPFMAFWFFADRFGFVVCPKPKSLCCDLGSVSTNYDMSGLRYI